MRGRPTIAMGLPSPVQNLDTGDVDFTAIIDGDIVMCAVTREALHSMSSAPIKIGQNLVPLFEGHAAHLLALAAAMYRSGVPLDANGRVVIRQSRWI